MDIHEYQAKKKILSDFGIHIPRGGIAYSPENAEYKAREIGGSKWVVKAQIHSGARGKAGGIIICNDELEVAQATDKLLGKKLVTNQTGASGKIDWQRLSVRLMEDTHYMYREKDVMEQVGIK